MIELKPCPFCKSTADYIVGDYQDGEQFVKVYCRVCQVRTPNTANHYQAAATWNTRASPMPVELVEAGSLVGRDDYVLELEAENASLREIVLQVSNCIGCGCGGDYGLCKSCAAALEAAQQEQKG